MMDTLHSVLRSIRGEDKARRDHLTVFREFLAHLDRVHRREPARTRPDKRARASGKRNGKG
jgi:hypothetical protein